VKGLRYNWFTALELPFSQQRFAAPEYLARFGFPRRPATTSHSRRTRQLARRLHPAQNPGSDVEFLDITCAACHTGELRYQWPGPAHRRRPGPARAAFQRADPARWQLRPGVGGQPGRHLLQPAGNSERFAHACWAINYEAQHNQLRQDFKVAGHFPQAVAWNDTHRGLYPTEEGPGRTDAFGRIANASFGDAISPDNYRVANAPVDYPHLWDMWTFDWVQWNGSAQQPMARNIGEALGVGATLNFFDSHGQPLQGRCALPFQCTGA
jgi:hypothetical protein